MNAVKKEKKEASKVSGRLEDKVLAVKYWLTEEGQKSLLDDRQLFTSVIHLYCLRVSVAAYRKSLTVGN